MLTFQPVQATATIPILCNLAREIQIPYFTPIIGEAQINYMLELFLSENAVKDQIKKGYQYRLVSHNGELCGYFAVFPEDNKLFLSKFYLKEHFRGKGLGKKMMEEVCRLGQGLSSVYLTVNKQNHGPIAVYHALGFSIIDSVETDIGNGYIMDDYIMEKSLMEPMENL